MARTLQVEEPRGAVSAAASAGEGPRPVGESMPRLLARLGRIPDPRPLMDVVFTRWEEVVGAELGGHVCARSASTGGPSWSRRTTRRGPPGRGWQSADILARVQGARRDTPVERLEVVVERA